MKRRYRPHRKKPRWVILRPSEEGSGVEYWTIQGTWMEVGADGQPVTPYDIHPVATYDTRPDPLQVTGYANAVASPLD
jgi:hypothetical protein